VLLNGKQIHPQTTPLPEIFVHQVPAYHELREFDYDLSNSYNYDLPFYPLSHLGYVVNVGSQAHPPGSSDASLVTLNFRIIQVGAKVVDCLDSIELSLLQTTRHGAFMVKGARFQQNEESYLPDTDDSSNYRYPSDAVVTDSGFRKCHPSPVELSQQDRFDPYLELYYYNPPCLCPRSFTHVELVGVILGAFLGGVVTTLLGVYFRVGLKKGTVKAGSAIYFCSLGVWGRLRRGRSGAIRLPTSAKGDVEREPEQE
jgi:hypothetical protein